MKAGKAKVKSERKNIFHILNYSISTRSQILHARPNTAKKVIVNLHQPTEIENPPFQQRPDTDRINNNNNKIHLFFYVLYAIRNPKLHTAYSKGKQSKTGKYHIIIPTM